MSLITIAGLIPANYRKEILELNMVNAAIAIASDAHMFYLFIIWKNYVEPGQNLSLECNLCLARILENYRQMQSTLIEMEKDSNLLKLA